MMGKIIETEEIKTNPKTPFDSFSISRFEG